MSNPKLVYRKKAVDAMQQVDDCSQPLEIVPVKGWLALLVLLVLSGLILVWAIFSSMATYVSGRGILLQGDGMDTVVAPSSGHIVALQFKVGDYVEQNAILGKLYSMDTEDKLRVSTFESNHAKQDLHLFSSYDSRTYEAQLQALKQKQNGLITTIEKLKAQLGVEEKRLTARERLLADGLLDPDSVSVVKSAVLAREVELSNFENQLSELHAQIRDFERQHVRQSSQYRFDFDRSNQAHTQLKNRVDVEENIRSVYSGIVTEILKNKGDMVTMGEALFTIELETSHNSLEAIIFVPASQGKRIQEGMMITVSPSTAKKEMYGCLVGKVTFVSPYPESASAMQTILHNESLIATLTSKEPVLRVVARISVDPKTPSGLRWTSKRGPKYLITGGTLCEGHVVIESSPPLLVVFPFLNWLFRR